MQDYEIWSIKVKDKLSMCIEKDSGCPYFVLSLQCPQGQEGIKIQIFGHGLCKFLEKHDGN